MGTEFGGLHERRNEDRALSTLVLFWNFIVNEILIIRPLACFARIRGLERAVKSPRGVSWLLRFLRADLVQWAIVNGASARRRTHGDWE
jgi:hypothetical protein